MEISSKQIWHPYTSLTNPLTTYKISSAAGVYLNLECGNQLIDGMSSWWACIHGYNHPQLNQAAEKQLKNMSHVMFGGLTHDPAELLADKLLEIVPKGLDNIFYCDSGSVAVEVAMKMALQYQQAKGNVTKSKFLTARFGYHGDTTGAMSVCDPISGMHGLFSDFLPKHFFGEPFPLGCDKEVDMEIIKNYEKIFEKNHHDIAAFIIEPVVQGAGGMRIYNPLYLRHIQTLCKKYNILFIADEIATGFGRTGKLFACEHAEIEPDILCLGKAISGGYLSFAATLSTKEIATTISNHPPNVFMHGPTFMANPLACSIALASLNLLFENDWQKQISKIESILKRELAFISNVKDVRILGAIGIIEFYKEIDVTEAQKFFVSKGVWIRPFRNLVYIMPPYIIEEKELVSLTNVMKEIVSLRQCFKAE